MAYNKISFDEKGIGNCKWHKYVSLPYQIAGI
jgi:hypothetical protein